MGSTSADTATAAVAPTRRNISTGNNNNNNNDEQSLYDDWKGFLVADRSDLRVAATQAVLQVMTGSAEQLIQQGMVPLLAKNTTYDDEVVAVNALRALVYLSSHGPSSNQCVADLQECHGLNRMLEIALSKQEGNSKSWRQRVNYALALAANLTRTEEGAVALVGASLPDEAVDEKVELLPTKPTLELLLARFLSTAYLDSASVADDYYETAALENSNDADSHDADPYQHFAAILLNASQTEQGRRFLLKLQDPTNDPSKCVLQTLLPQLRSPNAIRRRGIAGTVRNCCLERDSAWWFLHVLKITTHLLYPLAGPEELDVEEKRGLDPELWLEGPDKRREPDHWTRLFLTQAVLLLCATGRASRETLRLQRTYVILKWADMVEEHEDVSEQIYDCVNFLRRDEEGMAEGSSDQMVEEAYNKSKPSVARQIGNSEDDFDNVD